MKNEKNSTKDTGHSFVDYFKRATSPMVVLKLLNEKPMYVYQMMQELETRSKGQYTMSMLYPVLYRLTQQKYVVLGEKAISDDNRVRQYYNITPNGKQYLAELESEYDVMDQAVRSILSYAEDGEDQQG